MQVGIHSEKFKGISGETAKNKLKNEGYNELPTSRPKNFLHIAMGVVTEPMFILLVACGTLYMVLGNIREGMILLSFVFVIMAIELSPRALVIRDGEEKRIPGREVVREDIIVLQEGDRVPADATVIYCTNLLVDESLLTGESVPVRKMEWDGNAGNLQPGGDDLPFVFSASMIVQGTGVAVVSGTGINTEIGKIGKALESVKEEATKLQKEMGVLVKRIAISGIVLCILVVVAYTLSRGNLVKGLLAGISLAMAMLPEEFPVVLAIFMALGAWRMSKKKVLTRKPSAIETLGSATVLCTDKTGTLTQNKMTVSRLYNGEAFLAVDHNRKLPEEFHEIIEYGILSSQTKPFDPMEKAITRMGDLFLAGTEHLHTELEMVKEYPLSRELLAMSRVYGHKLSYERTIATKGAPEAIFDLCHLPEAAIRQHEKGVEEMAANGLRVLGVAKARVNLPDILPVQHDYEFEFLGLIGLTDPVRENVKEAVDECHKAGIRVIMITGDYPVTARNIAREIGLSNPDNCITGKELNEMTEDELCLRIKQVDVFARVIPDQKLKIVNALRKNGEIVAMTGDGINDAPALKSANIGIAMGDKGTDVAREASSLVLMDDNFLSIVGAIRMGRRIFDNLQKAMGYIFAIHVPIAGLSLIPVLIAKLPLILWPVHIVFLELIIDPACTLIFEGEPEEKNVMNRPPKPVKERFFGAKKVLLSCLQGAGILFIVMFIYSFGLYLGYNEPKVRTLAFTTLIVSNIAVIITNRSWTRNIFEIIRTPNTAVKWVVGGAIAFLVLILNLPFLLNLFQLQRISLLDAAFCTLAGFSTIIWFEVYKFIMLKRGKTI
ncbi:MAG: cation-translocating P-type ATPase [Bacteroidetes bacterium]|nr:cation-translocating P-type ATPase [Bacteroidota bacterium]